ncbi:acetyl-CoA carboxylase biotin carboxylase subunit family protein [Micromonospora sp. MH99]|uniref:ATP-grasp domain-containing protein n=1 Tax=Micromonospora sp. MH99 TaxID=1945510 RepID=UPI001F174AA9|nr:ATP-grasp domain-containing protein [Micromonospora sp. MH99]MCF0091257.1 Dapdiamide A synthase [Micromonospora sp. MH99]
MTGVAPQPGGSDFVQVGATRDGLDPYLDCARSRRMRAVLVETASYLRRRRDLGRRQFDVELAVSRPEDPRQVIAALAEAGIAPALLLTGFERYVDAAFTAARSLGTAPWPRMGATFEPLHKQEQRAALARVAPELPQPRSAVLAADGGVSRTDLAYPQVVKPVDGGGGLGVLLAADEAQRRQALSVITGLRNYGGASFEAVITEEFVRGPEVSLQGVVRAGRVYLLSVCHKLTAVEPQDAPGATGLSGFREIGHVAEHGDHADAALHRLARSAVDAAGYREGPFHLDAILGDAGPVFVEMGFRLSGGGLVALVAAATGMDWADIAVRCHLDDTPPALLPPRSRHGVAGQVSLTSPQELAVAEAMADVDPDVRILRLPAPPERDLPAVDRAALASDVLRHAGALGRLLITGDHVDEVLKNLRSVVADRWEG